MAQTALQAAYESGGMLTAKVDPDFASTLEKTEVEAWLDLYAAAPADFAERFGLRLVRGETTVATLCTAIPFIHFNCAMDLGMNVPATEAELDDLLATYGNAGVKRPWIYHTPFCQPAELPDWMTSRGMRQQGGWDRIFRDGAALDPIGLTRAADSVVERIDRTNAVEWAGFIDGMYRLPTSPWLISLVGRPGWRHYALRQGGQLKAVRSCFQNAEGFVWMGIEAPVPGIMAPSFDLDAQIVETMIRDGLAAGARLFVADIEAPVASMDGQAYGNFAALGFSKAYFRAHYGF